jgi:photosystem II stability/assembly factor-like uncharacterized protein
MLCSQFRVWRCLSAVLAVLPVTALQGGEDWMQTAGPATANLTGLAANGNQVVATGVRGAFYSADGGFTWRRAEKGPLDRATFLEAVTFVGETVFCGGTGLGFGPFRSDDGGRTWIDVSGGLPRPGVSDFAVRGPELFATSNRALFTTPDLGQTWNRIDTPDAVVSIHVDGQTFFAGSGNGLGVLRSLDGGQTWTTLSNGLAFDIYEHIAATQTALFVGGQFGIFRSTDLGERWTKVSDAIGSRVRVRRLFGLGTTLYAAVYHDARDEVYVTTDDGATWTWLGEGLPVGLFLRALAASGGDTLLATSAGVFRLPAGAPPWVESKTGMLGASLLGLGGNSQVLLALDASVQAVYRTGDAGDTWEAVTDGLPVGRTISVQFREVLAGDDTPGFVGTDRYGVYRSDDDGASWTEVNTGYPTYNGTAGRQFREVGALVRNSRFVFAGTGYGTEFFDGQFRTSGGGVYRTPDKGASWEAASSGLPIIGRNNFNEPVYAPVNAMFANEGVLLASVFRSGIFRSTNQGSTWIESNAGLPRDRFGNLPEFSEFVELAGRIFGAARFFSLDSGGEGVFRSEDGGQSWARSDSGLPVGRPVNSITRLAERLIVSVGNALDPQPGDGVYVSEDGGANWSPVGEVLQGTPVGPLAVSGGQVFAGTSGQSVWRLEAGCAEDLNGDGRVDQADLATLLSCYGESDCGDIDGDGDTDQADLAALLALYGQLCP